MVARDINHIGSATIAPARQSRHALYTANRPRGLIGLGIIFRRGILSAIRQQALVS